ncbi:MAG: hypothetical protein Q8L86_16655 [Vicinamibacterales bacterium]|nr:hypothetical protein [Vicinamibacterales bacterium]
MSPSSRARVMHGLVWLPVLAYALVVGRQFFHYADAAISLASDDGVGNIAYALATEGRYGFLSSPILAGLPRDDGLFSYGPFYFYAGAALIWLFGYNLMLLRFIHLAVVLAIAAAARRWFGSAAGGAAGAFAAIGLLMAFERAQWPMVRPDSMVSLFAVVLVISAGLAIRTGAGRYWCIAGLAGACGAFTHLVAWSLVPAVAAILVLGLLVDARDEEGRWRRPVRVWFPLALTAAGGLAGTFLFYASFGFRFAEQWHFLLDYQRFTGSMGGGASPGFLALVLAHFEQAYWYLPYPLAYGVWATLAAAVVVVPAVLVFDRGPRRRETLAWVGPPTVVWVGYLLSLGTYNNFHAGYAMLNQVMWLWTGAALVAAGLAGVRVRPALGVMAERLAWTTAVLLGIGMLTVLAARTDFRALDAAARTPAREYSERVLHALPVRARAWGSVELGIEHPSRIQLVQFWDAIRVVEAIDPPRRPPLAPDYLVWGHVENGGSTREVLAMADREAHGVDGREIHVGPQRLLDAFPDARYTLVSLVAAPPYGVTRVYAWAGGAHAFSRPLLSVFDPIARQWSSAAGPAVPVELQESAPATLRIGVEPAAPARQARQTLRGELPPGHYLLRIAMAPDGGGGDAVVVLASTAAEITEDITDARRGVDASPRFAGEPAVYLVHRHPGGPLYVSQFGTGPSAIVGVEAMSILALPDYAGLRRAPVEHPLPASSWTAAFPALSVSPAGTGNASVRGDETQFGYQAYGPRIPVQRGLRVRIRPAITIQAGRACFGVLDGTEERWLVAPDALLPEYEFVVNDSATVKPVLANCNGTPEGIVPTEATIGDGSYALWPEREGLYVDELMREFRNATPR